jgi:hypothetical protein
MNSKYWSLILFCISIGIQIVNMVAFGETSANDRLFESFYFVISTIFFLVLIYGVYVGVRHMVMNKKLEIFSVFGVLFNGGWVLIFILAYCLMW